MRENLLTGDFDETRTQLSRSAKSKTDAQDYFGIMPPAGDGKALTFDRSMQKQDKSAISAL